MFRAAKALSLKAAITGLAVFILTSPAQAETYGTWRNPSGSVQVEIYDCGSTRCGRVVWANQKAQNDAKRGSGKELIGMTILRNFTQDSKGVWRGRAYVPDIDREFSGSAKLVNGNQLRVKGCLMGRVGCKSQTWTRIGS